MINLQNNILKNFCPKNFFRQFYKTKKKTLDAVASKNIKKPWSYLNLKFSLKFDIYPNALKIVMKILRKNADVTASVNIKMFKLCIFGKILARAQKFLDAKLH